MLPDIPISGKDIPPELWVPAYFVFAVIIGIIFKQDPWFIIIDACGFIVLIAIVTNFFPASNKDERAEEE